MQTILFNLNSNEQINTYNLLTKDDKFQNQPIMDRKVLDDEVELTKLDNEDNEIKVQYKSKIAIIKVDNFKSGQKINHYIFGEGTITNADENYVDVLFADGEKHFTQQSLLDCILYENETFDNEFYSLIQNTYGKDEKLKLYKKYNKNKSFEDDAEFWDWLEAKCF